jgi:hypothetical protein
MHLTKSPKTWIIVVSIALAAFLGSGATSSSDSRPPGVDEAAWLPISDSAGLVVVRTPESGKVAGKLYGKRDNRWVEIIVESSPTLFR